MDPRQQLAFARGANCVDIERDGPILGVDANFRIARLDELPFVRQLGDAISVALPNHAFHQRLAIRQIKVDMA